MSVYQDFIQQLEGLVWQPMQAPIILEDYVPSDLNIASSAALMFVSMNLQAANSKVQDEFFDDLITSVSNACNNALDKR